MNNERITYLYNRYLDDKLEPMELEEFKQILEDSNFQEKLSNLIDQDWEHLRESSYQRLPEEKLQQHFVSIAKTKQKKEQLEGRVAKRVLLVAAAVAFIGLCIHFFNYRNNKIGEEVQIVMNDVAPGKIGATLTLASGKKIRLTDAAIGELANEAGISITKTASGQLVYEIRKSDADPNKINTLSTTIGETYQVRLPDGSMVYLNAASSLTYSASLNERGKRVVRLRGEGYFEIFKDKVHPFVVITDKQEVEVLGTHFNINAYADEQNVKTTLIEGSVKVNTEMTQQIIKPGEQATNNGEKINVAKVDTERITDWKDNDFVFNGDDLKTAMRKIARWYNVDVVYAKDLPKNINPGGWISRNNNISAVLKMIEASGLVHFKVEGRRVLVTK